jgi:hypothetical protein
MVKSFTNLLRPEFGQPTYAASYGSNLAHAAWGYDLVEAQICLLDLDLPPDLYEFLRRNFE